MAKKKRKKNKKNSLKVRNPYRILQDRGELNLSTRSESKNKPKYTRKEKHKKKEE